MALSRDGLRRAALTLAVVLATLWYVTFVQEADAPDTAQNTITGNAAGSPGTAANNATQPENQ